MTQTLDRFGCRGNTIKLSNGKYFDLLDPDPDAIDLDVIASALGKICRFGGHCPRFYSVAEHSVLAHRIAVNLEVSNMEAIAILLHDAAEAFCGDVVKPLKQKLPEYGDIEQRIERAIGERFDIDFGEYRGAIKRVDQILLKAEKQYFWPDDKEEWEGFAETPSTKVGFYCWHPDQAAGSFSLAAMERGLK